MPSSDIPRLCGGLFLLQLLRMKKPSTRTKAEGLKGQKDSVNNQRVFEALIRIFYPDFKINSDESFAKDTAEYRACKKSAGINLPFKMKYCDSTPFDTMVKTRYNDILPVVSEFADLYLDLEDTKACDAVKAILQTIATDTTIEPEDIFYINGAMTKQELLEQEELVLEPFLLGIWHFILLHKPNNLVGRDTFLDWNEQGIEGDQWTYTSHIGKDYPLDIKLSQMNGYTFYNNSDTVDEEVLEEDTEEYTSEDIMSPAYSAYRVLFQQIIINPVVNQFIGVPGSSQIANNNGIININFGATAPSSAPIPYTSQEPLDEEYYHLIVGYTYKNRIIIDKSRALNEYISEETKQIFSTENTNLLKGLPALIMPEADRTGAPQDVTLGYVTKVRSQDNGVILYVSKDLEFPMQLLIEHKELFGISHIFELSRTHWTIKHINLLEAMEDAGIHYE